MVVMVGTSLKVLQELTIGCTRGVMVQPLIEMPFIGMSMVIVSDSKTTG